MTIRGNNILFLEPQRKPQVGEYTGSMFLEDMSRATGNIRSIAHFLHDISESCEYFSPKLATDLRQAVNGIDRSLDIIQRAVGKDLGRQVNESGKDLGLAVMATIKIIASQTILPAPTQKE